MNSKQNTVFFNRCFDKGRLKSLILWCILNFGEQKTVKLVEKLKDIGFHQATLAGVSLGIDDLKIPNSKAQLVADAQLENQLILQEDKRGNVTSVEKFQRLIDTWHLTSEILKDNVIKAFRNTDILNPVYMMAFSGARGNVSQVRQLVGMRGLMADPQGQIINFPIQSNFREGLTLTEYVISCYGARKGVVDTALRTATSGYLTRRLVDVAQHVIVYQFDCRTPRGILLNTIKVGNTTAISLQKRLVGRVSAEDIYSTPREGDLNQFADRYGASLELSSDPFVYRNQEMTPLLAEQISKVKKQVLVRSALTCQAKHGVCQLCYGWSLAQGSLVSLGEAVGVVAAQSIGEPGTQLTMRTFHTGGVFSGDVMEQLQAPNEGKVRFSRPLQGTLVRTLHGKIAFLSYTKGEMLLEQNETQTKIAFPSYTILYVRNGQFVERNQFIAEYSSLAGESQSVKSTQQVNAEITGEVFFEKVFLRVESSEDGEKTYRSFKFSDVWILSCARNPTQFKVTSNLTNAGDFIDTTTVINQITLKNGAQRSELKATNLLRSVNEQVKLATLPEVRSKLPNPVELFRSSQPLLETDLFKNSLVKTHYKTLGYFYSVQNLLPTLTNASNWSKLDPEGNRDKPLLTNNAPTELFFKHLNNLVRSDKKRKNEKPNYENLVTWYSDRFKTVLPVCSKPIVNPIFDSRSKLVSFARETPPSFAKNNLIQAKTTPSSISSSTLNSTRFTTLVQNQQYQNYYAQQVLLKQTTGNRVCDICDCSILKDKFAPQTRTSKTWVCEPKILRASALFKLKVRILENLSQLQFIVPTSYLLNKLVLFSSACAGRPGRTMASEGGLLQNSRTNAAHVALGIPGYWTAESKLSNLRKQSLGQGADYSRGFASVKSKTEQLLPSLQTTKRMLRNTSWIYYGSSNQIEDSTLHGLSLKSAQPSNAYKQNRFWGAQTLQRNKNPVALPKGIAPELNSTTNNSILLNSQSSKNNQNVPDILYTGLLNTLCKNETFNSFFSGVKTVTGKEIKDWLISAKSKAVILNASHTVCDQTIFLFTAGSRKTFERVKGITSGFAARGENGHSENTLSVVNLNYLTSKQNRFVPIISYVNTVTQVTEMNEIPVPKVGVYKKQFLKVTRPKFVFHTKKQMCLTLGLRSKIEKPKTQLTKLFSDPESDWRVEVNLPAKIALRFEVGEVGGPLRGLLRAPASQPASQAGGLYSQPAKAGGNTLTNKNQVCEANLPETRSPSLISEKAQHSGEMLKPVQTKPLPFTKESNEYSQRVLRDRDKKTFSVSTRPLVKVGDFVRYGTVIAAGVSISEPGLVTCVTASKMTIRLAKPALVSSGGVFHVQHGDFIEENSPFVTLAYTRLKTGDIVQGIPKIEELFEARISSALHNQLALIFENYKQKFSSAYAARKSLERIQQIIVENVLNVYLSQGVTIADKHVEIIVRQMTSKVRILESGRSGLLRGEFVNLESVENANKSSYGKKAEYEPILVGITKAALDIDKSFISAASFQETTRILSRAAIERKTDFLRGLKENVILGQLIPAGTGFSVSFEPEDPNHSTKVLKLVNQYLFTTKV
jgi:hypothetical protein